MEFRKLGSNQQDPIAVYFDNGKKVGELEYDSSWNVWQFVRMEKVRLQWQYLYEMAEYVKRLPTM